MKRQHLRRHLIGSGSVLAIVIATAGSVAAQTATDFSIDLLADPFNVSGTISAVNGNPISDIDDFMDAGPGTLTVGVTNNNTAGDVYLDVTPGATTANGNAIFAVGQANDKDNSIGFLPANSDGAAILQGQVADSVDLYAFSDGDRIRLQIFDNGDGSADFNGNSIFADAAFNRSLNTIEVDPTTDLAVPLTAGSLDAGLPSSSQEASLSVVNVQLNSEFGSDAGPDEPIAEVLDATIRVNRITDTDAAGETLLGTFNLIGNSIEARGSSNSSDNSILVGDGDSTSFLGTAFVTNVQASEDSNEVGIGAEVNDGSRIEFDFRQGAFGGGNVGSAVGLTVVADDNLITARALINSSRNEVSFDGDLILDGVLVEPAQQIIRMTDRAPDTVEADYAVVNVQAAASLAGGLEQGASALNLGSSIELHVEDVDSASSLSFGGNALSAVAGGNSAQNIIGNVDGVSSPSVSAVAANYNFQLLDQPAVSATLEDGIVELHVGIDVTDPGDIFGGFEASSLAFNGNAITASGFGNVAQATTAFQASSLTMLFADNGGVDPNDGANLNSNNGETDDLGNYRASGGAATLSYQLLTGATSSDAAVAALVDGSGFSLLINDPAAPAADQGLSTATIDLNGNLLAASAVGNSFSGSTTLDAASAFTGSAGMLAYQGATGQNVVADVVDGGIFAGLGYDPAAGASALDLSVSGNAVTALASINSLSTSITASALAIEGGADGNDNNARIFGSLDTITGQIAGRNRARGDASLTLLSDQINAEGSASAEMAGGTVELLINDGGAASTIAASEIDVSGNSIGAQSRGNQASNEISVDALAATTAQEGALAGIISQQVNANLVAPTVDQGDPEASFGTGSLIYAGTALSGLAVETTGLLNSELAVEQNRVLANAVANSVANELNIEAGTLDLDTTSTSGVNLAVTVVPATEDVQLDVISAGAYILNAQRNEALVPGDNAAPDAGGPAVLALFGVGDAPNSLSVIVGSSENSSIDVNGNGMLATARANDAGNSLSFDIGSGAVNGGILNSQINSGDVTALNAGSSMTTSLNGDGNSGLSVTMDGNQIGSSALGNNASNSLSATAATGFSGIAGSVGPVATVPAGTDVVINNGALDANGNLVVVNTQTSYGVGETSGLTAGTSGALIALNAEVGATTGSNFSLSGNSIGATVGANTASNSITAASGTGGLPSATIVSAQSSSGVSLSATVSDSTISATLGAAGGAGSFGGSVTMSGNTIGATGSINSGSNTIGAPGQTFTRTSSF